MSLKIPSFISIINILLALSVALTIEKRHFARFRNCHDASGFVNMGVACEILHLGNRGVR